MDALIAGTSGRNSRSSTRPCGTSAGVSAVVMPMTPRRMPSRSTIAAPGRNGWPVPRRTTFPESHVTREPFHGWPRTGPLGCAPPYRSRSSSAVPRSNSWLPSTLMKRQRVSSSGLPGTGPLSAGRLIGLQSRSARSFRTSIIGSSRSSPEAGGLPPIESPAIRTMLRRGLCWRSAASTPDTATMPPTRRVSNASASSPAAVRWPCRSFRLTTVTASTGAVGFAPRQVTTPSEARRSCTSSARALA